MLRDYINQAVQNKNVIMFITAVFFMAGILSYFQDCAIQIAVVITLILLILNLGKYISYKYLLLWMFIFYFGFFNSSLRVKNSDDLVSFAPTDAVITGKIVSIPNGTSKDKTKFFVSVSDINGEKIKAKTLVNLSGFDESSADKLNIGNSYKITGKLRTPFKASNPSQFDYGKYLRNFNTYTVFYADYSACEFLSSADNAQWKFMQGLNNIRNRIISTHSLFLKSPNLEILGGIVFGDDAVAPPDYIKDTFKNSGLLHILAASGMNVAFIYGFWYFILRRLRVPMKMIIVSGMVVVILYTFMTGLGASVVRAALMLLFVLAGKLIDRDSHSISLLAFVASLMLVYNPAYINDVGFQLSFIVTFGLLTTANIIMNSVKSLPVPDWLCAEVLIPIVSQLWVIPLQMFYFNTISTYAVFANVSIMPFLSVISFGGFISSVLAIITPIAKYVCMVFDFVLKFCLDILVCISNFFSGLPHSVIQTTHPSVLQVFLYYVVLLIITLMFKFGFRKSQMLLCGVILSVIIVLALPVPNNKLEVISFDVQHADAFLIKMPSNKYFMIDTGKAPYNGGKSQAEVIILKFLKDKGIKNIEGLVITHFDNDHSGGASDLISNLNVNKVYLNSEPDGSYTTKLIKEALEKRKTAYEIISGNTIIYDDGKVSLTLDKAKCNTDNENSLVSVLNYNDFGMLFMGDAGVDAYKQLRLNIKDKNIDVLKVGHHGARGVVNDSMLSELKPEVSLISTGKNTFGHPNPATVDILRKTDIYRTDRNNSIKISVDKNNYSIYTYDKNVHKYRKFKTYSTAN